MALLGLLVVLFAVTACSPDGAPRRGPVTAADPVKPTEALRPPERDPSTWSAPSITSKPRAASMSSARKTAINTASWNCPSSSARKAYP